jgi:glc operon protein GlcG
MTKLGIGVGVLATVSCLSVGAQTINATTLDQAGAQMVLQAAKASALQRHASSAIAVVDPAGDLLAFERMDGVRPASADLAIGKARTAARLQRPTAEIEDSINQGRTAFVTANIAALRGGIPMRVGGQVVGAVGTAGLSKETDTDLANTAAAALGPSPETAGRHREGYRSCGLCRPIHLINRKNGVLRAPGQARQSVPPYFALSCLAKPRYGSFMTSTSDGN